MGRLRRLLVHADRYWGVARATYHEQPVVTALALFALLAVVARTSLETVPQVLPGGARWGGVIYDLAIAYLAAWFFNLLVVVLPRFRALARIAPAVTTHIVSMLAPGWWLSSRIAESFGHIDKDYVPTQEEVSTWASQITSWTQESFNLRADDDGSGQPYLTWREYFHTEVFAEIDRARDALAAYFGVLDADVVQEIENLVHLPGLECIRFDVSLEGPGGGLRGWESSLWEWLDACNTRGFPLMNRVRRAPILFWAIPGDHEDSGNGAVRGESHQPRGH